jgi:hypothetical protein
MRKILLLILIASGAFSISAQTSSAKYFIGAFNPLLESESVWKDGLNRINDDGVIIFLITNKTLQYKIALNHFSYLNKPTDPVVLDMPIAQLENLENVIPATDLLNFEDADSAYKWMVELFSVSVKEIALYNEVRTKIYVIDTNRFYKSDPALEEPDMMKVVEVRVWPEDIPDHILNPL